MTPAPITNFHLKNRTTARLHQRGFSLIETLVAILIFSFGVLGAVGLQATALQSNRDTREQSIALNLASEMADHIRSNHAQSVDSTAATQRNGLPTRCTAVRHPR